MSKKEIKTIGAKHVFAWIFSIIFILAGIGTFTESILAGVFMLLAGIIILPPFNKMLEEKANLKLTTWLKIIIVLVLLMFSGMALPNTSSDNSNSGTLAPTDNSGAQTIPSTETTTPYSLGQTFTFGEFNYKYTNMQTKSYVGEYLYGTLMGDEPNGIYLIFDVEIENIGNEANYINDAIYIIDSQGREYEQDDSAWIYLDDNIVFDELNPGLTKKGQIIFDVPQNLDGKLCMKKSSWSSDCSVYISY